MYTLTNVNPVKDRPDLISCQITCGSEVPAAETIDVYCGKPQTLLDLLSLANVQEFYQSFEFINNRHEMEDFVNYCEDCDRYYDCRSGCETDIRHDEKYRLLRIAAVILVVVAGLALIYWRIS